MWFKIVQIVSKHHDSHRLITDAKYRGKEKIWRSKYVLLWKLSKTDNMDMHSHSHGSGPAVSPVVSSRVGGGGGDGTGAGAGAGQLRRRNHHRSVTDTTTANAGLPPIAGPPVSNEGSVRLSQLLDESDHIRCSEGNQDALLSEALDRLRGLT